jgi:hypothetical protein
LRQLASSQPATVPGLFAAFFSHAFWCGSTILQPRDLSRLSHLYSLNQVSCKDISCTVACNRSGLDVSLNRVWAPPDSGFRFRCSSILSLYRVRILGSNLKGLFGVPRQTAYRRLPQVVKSKHRQTPIPAHKSGCTKPRGRFEFLTHQFHLNIWPSSKNERTVLGSSLFGWPRQAFVAYRFHVAALAGLETWKF